MPQGSEEFEKWRGRKIFSNLSLPAERSNLILGRTLARQERQLIVTIQFQSLLPTSASSLDSHSKFHPALCPRE